MSPASARVNEPHRLEVTGDEELVTRARGGDRRAKEQLFHRYVRRVSGIVYRLMGHDHDLEDIVQDTFVQAFDKLDKLQDPSAFAPWLLRMTTGTVIDLLRRRSMLRRLGLWSKESFDLDTLVSGSAPAEIALELRTVYSLLARFPVDERVVLVLRRVEELTLDEMAEYTGWSVATVKRRLSKAEQRLDALSKTESRR